MNKLEEQIFSVCRNNKEYEATQLIMELIAADKSKAVAAAQIKQADKYHRILLNGWDANRLQSIISDDLATLRGINT